MNQSKFNILTKWLRYNQFSEILTDSSKSNIVLNSALQIIRKRYVRYIHI